MLTLRIVFAQVFRTDETNDVTKSRGFIYRIKKGAGHLRDLFGVSNTQSSRRRKYEIGSIPASGKIFCKSVLLLLRIVGEYYVT